MDEIELWLMFDMSESACVPREKAEADSYTHGRVDLQSTFSAVYRTVLSLMQDRISPLWQCK